MKPKVLTLPLIPFSPVSLIPPANRVGTPAEIADKWVKPESIAQVICFLASEAAKDVRGAAIPVYGNL
jgi:NAD(P)-dependent dehydrogenase (short-subunit alcohol dehydrogenase family)